MTKIDVSVKTETCRACDGHGRRSDTALNAATAIATMGVSFLFPQIREERSCRSCGGTGYVLVPTQISCNAC